MADNKWGDPTVLKAMGEGARSTGLAAPVPDPRMYGDKKAYDAWLAAQASAFARDFAADKANHYKTVTQKWAGPSGNQWQALYDKARTLGLLADDGSYVGPAEAVGGAKVPDATGGPPLSIVDRMKNAVSGLNW